MKTRSEKLKISLTVLVTSIASFLGVAQPNAPTLKSKGLAPVNGIRMYYEVHGEGKPLVLLHGGFMTIELNWSKLIAEFAKSRKVVAFELQGHGHTELTKRPYSYPTLATDVVQALKYLKIDRADFAGYSFGGMVAYQIAFQNPEVVNSLTIISAAYKFEGWQSESQNDLRAMTPELMTSTTPLRAAYVAVAPDSSKWHEFASKMLPFIVDFNLGGEDKIKNLKMPVLLIYGDNDGMDKTFLFQTYRALGGGVFADKAGIPQSQLAILPGKSHVSLMTDSQGIYTLMNAFLK